MSDACSTASSFSSPSQKPTRRKYPSSLFSYHLDPRTIDPLPFQCPLPHDSISDAMRLHDSVGDVLAHLARYHHVRVHDPSDVKFVWEEYLRFYAARISLDGDLSKPCKDEYIRDGINVGALFAVKIDGLWTLGGGDECHEDKKLRNLLRRRKLIQMLKKHEEERADESKRPHVCLFCRIVFDRRTELFDHMYHTHSFHVGLPDNLVYIDELLSVLRAKLSKVQCIYCERTFASQLLLRKHMRKKKHFRIHPDNPTYDRFYLINYALPDGDTNCAPLSALQEEDEEGSWSDWQSDTGDQTTTCLFCDETSEHPEIMLSKHMVESHGFDLRKLSEVHKLDFYDRVKVVNFIRRHLLVNSCFSCQKTFETRDDLLNHMSANNHFKIPDKDAAITWNESQYLLPTVEDDPLLQALIWEDEEQNSTMEPIEKLPNTNGVELITAEMVKLKLAEAAELLKSLRDQLSRE